MTAALPLLFTPSACFSKGGLPSEIWPSMTQWFSESQKWTQFLQLQASEETKKLNPFNSLSGERQPYFLHFLIVLVPIFTAVGQQQVGGVNTDRAESEAGWGRCWWLIVLHSQPAFTKPAFRQLFCCSEFFLVTDLLPAINTPGSEL